MKKLLLALFFLAFATCADAASCFWVGGTNTWSTANGVNWSSSSGGAGSTCAATGGVPKQAADTATFDALSGGGTVTVDSTMNGTTLTTITGGAHTGTLDFSVNNPSMTLGANGTTAINYSGAGTRTLKLGSGTFTCKSSSNVCLNVTTNTGLTFDTTSTATISIAGSGNNNADQVIAGTVSTPNNTLNVTSGGIARITASQTFLALTFSGTTGGSLVVNSGVTLTITNALALTGTSTGLAIISSDQYTAVGSGQGTIALSAAGGTANWALFIDMAFTINTLSAPNSFSGGNTSGVTITGPSAGGGGHIIGG